MTPTAGVVAPAPSLLNSGLAAMPLPIVVQNMSAVAAFCGEHRAAGIQDIAPLLAEPGCLADLLESVVVTDANQAAAALCGVTAPSELLGPCGPELMVLITPQSFVDQIVAVFEGRTSTRSEIDSTDSSGQARKLVVNWAAKTASGGADYAHTTLVAEQGPAAVDDAMGETAHSEQLQALIEIGGQLTSMLDPRVIFDKVLETIREALQPTRMALTLIDTDKRVIVENAGTAMGGEGDPLSYEILMGGLCGTAVQSGVALISDDISQERGFAELARSVAQGMPGWSQIAAPIVSGGTAIGVVHLLFEPDRAKPTAEAASFIATLAGQVAVAIKNADVYAELAEGHAALQAAHRQLQDTQTQLLSAQKMEAIGSLAAGIAHEINTPIQYVSDNVSFLRDSSQTTGKLLAKVTKIMERVAASGQTELLNEFHEAMAEADWEFIVAEVPDAFDQTIEGVERVASIVRAMKSFAHPGSDEKGPVDINQCIETTVEVAKNEWKYIADIDLELDGDLPHVPALTGPFNQTILILVVNAAQALSEVQDSLPGGKGRIQISTAVDGDEAVIRVADNGPGIPATIADQIFDPFFTTKDVGKGSGQGLSIAHSVIVERHGGSIYAESEPGQGAIFVIRLPLTL